MEAPAIERKGERGPMNRSTHADRHTTERDRRAQMKRRKKKDERSHKIVYGYNLFVWFIRSILLLYRHITPHTVPLPPSFPSSFLPFSIVLHNQPKGSRPLLPFLAPSPPHPHSAANSTSDDDAVHIFNSSASFSFLATPFFPPAFPPSFPPSSFSSPPTTMAAKHRNK